MAALSVFKYPLRITDLQNVMMPEGAQILTAQMQHGELVLWALVNPEGTPQRREIEIVGTGNLIPWSSRRYIATAQDVFAQRERALVWHVFERE